MCISLEQPCVAAQLTDKGALAEPLSFGEILLPLKHCKSLVNQRQHVHAHGLLRLLNLNGLVELLDGLLVLLLIQEKLAVVVEDICNLGKVLSATTERRHG